jgi:hypothetical protein
MAPIARGAADLAWYAQRHIGRATPIVPVGLEYAERRPHVTTGRWPVSVRFGSPVLVDNAGCRAPTTRMLERQIASLSGLGDVLQPIAGEPFR